MKRTFIEFAGVTRVLRAEAVSDDAIRAMQKRVMEGGGDFVSGTAGLRKIRCSAGGRGKSGGIRIFFADYSENGQCLLVAAFAKNVKGNLSKSERNDLAKMKAMLDKQMKKKAER